MNQNLKTKFKGRAVLNCKPLKLIWGECGIFFYKQERFELIYYIYVRRFLKKLMKKGIYSYEARKYWVFLRPNLVLSKKSTNSRMGKGKGNFLRRTFRTKIFSPLVEFSGINPFLIKAFIKYLTLKTSLNYTCIFKNPKEVGLIGRPGYTQILYRKYNFF